MAALILYIRLSESLETVISHSFLSHVMFLSVLPLTAPCDWSLPHFNASPFSLICHVAFLMLRPLLSSFFRLRFEAVPFSIYNFLSHLCVFVVAASLFGQANLRKVLPIILF